MKQATLLSDEFNPKGYFKLFWKVPQDIARIKELSPGAKLFYGLIVVQCYKTGAAWPKHKTIRHDLGSVSEKTIYRWQKELIDLGLLRIRQKGRGLSNNYYLLRSPLIGNAGEDEFTSGARFVHKDIRSGAFTIVEDWLVWPTFMDDTDLWLIDAKQGITRPFPKPCGPHNRKAYGEKKRECEAKLQAYLDAM